MFEKRRRGETINDERGRKGPYFDSRGNPPDSSVRQDSANPPVEKKGRCAARQKGTKRPIKSLPNLDQKKKGGREVESNYANCREEVV